MANDSARSWFYIVKGNTSIPSLCLGGAYASCRLMLGTVQKTIVYALQLLTMLASVHCAIVSKFQKNYNMTFDMNVTTVFLFWNSGIYQIVIVSYISVSTSNILGIGKNSLQAQ